MTGGCFAFWVFLGEGDGGRWMVCTVWVLVPSCTSGWVPGVLGPGNSHLGTVDSKHRDVIYSLGDKSRGRAPNHAGLGPGSANSVALWFSIGFVAVESPRPSLPMERQALDVRPASPCSGATSLPPPTRQPQRGMLEPKAKSLQPVVANGARWPWRRFLLCQRALEACKCGSEGVSSAVLRLLQVFFHQ